MTAEAAPVPPTGAASGLTALDLEAKEIEYTYHGGLADMAQAARVGHGQREMDEQTASTDLAAQLRAARRREHADR